MAINHSIITLLHLAAFGSHYKEDEDIISTLLEYGANINAQNNIGLTPLHVAVLSGNNQSINIVQELIALGANVNTINNFNETVLDYALGSHADEEIIVLLKKHGAK